MRWLAVLLVACTPQATIVGANHPANPTAETGRLAGPPSALRPGVVTPPATKPEPKKPPDHSHH